MISGRLWGTRKLDYRRLLNIFFGVTGITIQFKLASLLNNFLLRPSSPFHFSVSHLSSTFSVRCSLIDDRWSPIEYRCLPSSLEAAGSSADVKKS